MRWFNEVFFFDHLQNKPAKNVNKVVFKQGARRSLSKLRNTLVHSHYRNDLKQVNIHKGKTRRIEFTKFEHDDYWLPSRSLMDRDYNFICYTDVEFQLIWPFDICWTWIWSKTFSFSITGCRSTCQRFVEITKSTKTEEGCCQEDRIRKTLRKQKQHPDFYNKNTVN